MSEKDEGFVRRWSRLKQEAREERPAAETPPPDLPAAATAANQPTPEAGDQPEEKPFDPATLPPIDSLTNESDYALFMRPEVPEALRQRALRRLWATDPVLSAPDGFDMHTLDYNAVPTFPEGVKTLYRIGQGMFDESEPEKADESVPTAADRAAEGVESGLQPPEQHPPDAAAQQEKVAKVKDSDAENT